MMDNRTIARWLTDYAHYLEGRRENLYRIRAYRRGAEAVLRLSYPAAEILEREGRGGLARLSGIGRHLAYTIDELVRTGIFRTWDERVRGPVIDAGGRLRHAKTEKTKRQSMGAGDVSACASDDGNDPLQSHTVRSPFCPSECAVGMAAPATSVGA